MYYFWGNWQLYHKVVFDGVNKRILVNSNETIIDVKTDLYSSWKEWALLYDHTKFEPAVRVIGGDPVGGGLYAGDIYFLINGWQIEITHSVTFKGTLYHDDPISPFIILPGGGVTSVVSNLAYAYSATGGTSNAPTVQEIRTEIDANSTQLAAIKAQTNTISSIPGLVWDEKLSNHITTGSYGSELATSSDIQASASTYTSTYSTGSIIAGNVISGTISNTIIRDGVYWNVAESVAGGTGLTVEYNFNLPSASHRAGTFKLYGRYDGKGSSHYIELWIWNVAGSAWELLKENFITSSTVDAEFSQSYFEENINRSSSNEVKIRLVHNVTTYHESHVLHIDSCNISSIDVVTAEKIAEAVRIELTPEMTHILLMENGLTATQATMLTEIYSLYGLDPTKPLVVTDTNRSAGVDIQQTISSGASVTTVTRV